MNISDCISRAQKGLPVFLDDLEHAFHSSGTTEPHPIRLELFDGKTIAFPLQIPSFEELDDEEASMVESFVLARLYNIFSAWGGKKLILSCDTGNPWYERFFCTLGDTFQLGVPKAQRTGYGKVMNVTERLLENLLKDDTPATFEIEILPPEVFQLQEPSSAEKTSSQGGIIRRLQSCTELGSQLICGVDIGGTDIKIAVSEGDRMLFFKEYDWNPAAFTLMEELIQPILTLVELMLLRYEAGKHSSLISEEAQTLLELAMARTSTLEQVQRAVDTVKAELKGKDLSRFDAIGLCFPDIVIQNRIVGGEVYKTRGIRNNTEVDYEAEFRKLSDLKSLLQIYCSRENGVQMTNDGPMAAFTAAVEMIFSAEQSAVTDGVFAHTLGTELGTGWVDEHGDIPEIPLEIYNFIIDLGSAPQRKYDPDDLRSVNNFNTTLPGTLQKYASQSGVFRLALQYFEQERPDLYQGLQDAGFVVEKQKDGKRILLVPTEPEDLRKPFLEHVMKLAGKEHEAEAEAIFREIGRYLGETWRECEKILSPRSSDRYLFGRLVKNPHCFSLMEEGFSSLVSDAALKVADDSLANTPLMGQLKRHETYTVAQFAQAVGAIYYANCSFDD